MQRLVHACLIALACLLLLSCAGGATPPKASAPTRGEPAPGKASPAASAWWTQANPATPAVETVLGANSSEIWDVQPGKYTVARDEKLGRDVITTGDKGFVAQTRARYNGVRRITAQLRYLPITTGYNTATLTVGKRDDKESKSQGYRVYAYAHAGTNRINATAYGTDGKVLHDLAKLAETSEWVPQNENGMDYYLRAYEQFLPGWPEDFRARIESDMADVPLLKDKWFELRIDSMPGEVSVWIDDRLVAVKRDASVDPEGFARLEVGPNAQIASLRVGPLPITRGFVPVSLTGYANGRSFLRGASADWSSLPPAGATVQVGGVPFVFAGVNTEGKDHLDLSRSLLREANAFGYHPSGPVLGGRWYGANKRDPARIQVRVPNGQYEALYVIAAADGSPESVPQFTAMFYRPQAGFAECFEATAPLATASASTGVTPLPIKLSNGRSANLWLVKIPLDPGRLSTFADMDVIEIELTKQTHLYRSYPDPINYGYHQGGPPSGVHIYAMTLGETPVNFAWEPDVFGHVWTAPEVPAYTAAISNRTDAPITGKLTVTTRSYDGTETTQLEKPVSLRANPSVANVKFSVPVKLNGYHDITATLELGDKKWVEKRSFARLATDTRSVKWTEGKGAMFGYWSYHGGHHTPKGDHHIRLMTLAGARQSEHHPSSGDVGKAIVAKHWGIGQGTGYYVAPQPWLAEDGPRDPAKVEEFRKAIMGAFKTWEEHTPEQNKPDAIYYFAEPHITPRLTAGNFPEYFGDPPFEYTDDEKKRLKMFFETAKLAGEIYRKEMPGRKLLIPWGDPGFAIPLLRAGFPTNLIDGCGIDVPNFERLPEAQLADNVVHRMYQLRKEFEKVGIKKPQLQYCEGIFVPTEPGAVTWREQMDIYTRWNLISMAYGVERFYSGWFAFDATNYYGSEHYGGCGIQRRVPYCDPKPAYAAFATMTQMLNEANFDGWVPTGSLTTYCLRFKKPDNSYVYALWTLRGKRPVQIVTNGTNDVRVTDEMNNTRPAAALNFADFKGGTVMTSPSVIYVTVGKPGDAVQRAIAGESDHTDSLPDKSAKQIADLGDGTWRFTEERDTVYENNHWGFYPAPAAAGSFSATVASDATQDKVLVTKLGKQERTRELMPWYKVLRPSKPIAIAGAASHLGLWVKGNSDWGRVIYVLRDAKGERWISIGTQDDYNCNDIHAWSSFNFDGWRYLRFEMPGHLGWDSYRKNGTTWWRSGVTPAFQTSGVESERTAAKVRETGDQIIDLPLALEAIIVERRTHILYVNDVQPVASEAVSFGKMFVEYASPGDATNEAVRLSRLRMPAPMGVPDLPNPIADLARDGVGAPTKITKLEPPEHIYDGTRVHVWFVPVEGATKYCVWVSAHADGRGATNMVPTGIKNGQLVTGLRAGIKLYYWVTYEDKDKKVSKPSPVREEVLIDNFKEK